jgi:hypothetical protein
MHKEIMPGLWLFQFGGNAVELHSLLKGDMDRGDGFFVGEISKKADWTLPGNPDPDLDQYIRQLLTAHAEDQ